MNAATHLDAHKINPADHLKIVGKIAGRHRGRQQADHDDITSTGYVGLCEAARAFDPARNLQFSTFADLVVKREIADQFNRTCGPVSVERDAARIEARARRAGTPIEDLPASWRRRVAAVREMREMSRVPMENCDGGRLYSEDDGPARVDDADEIRVLIDRAGLTPNQTACLLAAYGLDGRGHRPLKDVARERGISREGLRESIARAMAKLRRAAGVES